jgi:uncharacterized membrane protein YphA (DoxX/SURF4 family)
MTAGTNVEAGQSSKSAARFIPIIARVLLGLGFTIFGLNGFLNFIPPPKEPMPKAAMDFAGAMMQTGYMFKLVAGTQLVAGVLLLSNLFVPLALVLLMPILVNIIAFHLFLAPAPGAFAPGIVFTLLALYLAWVYRKAYRPLLSVRAKPNET